MIPFINFVYPEIIGLCGNINITLLALNSIGRRYNDSDFSILWRINNITTNRNYLN